MARVETVNAQVTNPSILSPEAAVFVPRHFPQNGEMSVPVQEIPSYMTNCYPFVQNEVHGRPRGSWPRNSRPPRHNFPVSRMSRQFSAHHPGCNRMPGPHKFQMEPPFPLSSPPPPPWPTVVPFNLLAGGAPGFQNPLNGMPFDGGTSETTDNLNNNGEEIKDTTNDNMKKRNHSGDKRINEYNNKSEWQPGRDRNGKRNRDRQRSGPRRKNDPGTKINVAVQNNPNKIESIDPAIVCVKTVLYIDTAVQTDFPERIANLTLIQHASPLFCLNVKSSKSFKVSDSNDSEVDSDSGYSSPLHKRNQVSNGTQPVVSIETMTFTSSIRKSGPPRDSGAPVPQQKVTYASIAQKMPSQNHFVKQSTSVNENSCDRPQSNKTSVNAKDKIKNENAMLRTLDSKNAISRTLESKNAMSRTLKSENAVPRTLESKNAMSRTLKSENTVTRTLESNNAMSRTFESENAMSRTLDTSQKNKNESADDANLDVKKKRKRNRKRKKKKKNGEEVEEVDNQKPQEEIELHFEDDEEFPDLSGGFHIKNSSSLQHTSPLKTRNDNVGPDFYQNKIMDENIASDKCLVTGHVTENIRVQSAQVSNDPITCSSILQTKRTSPVKKEIPKQSVDRVKEAWSKQQDDQKARSENIDQLSSKAAKKRRKRREMVNKAAEDELAEISLEQQVLKAEHLKTKQSKMSAKETVTQQPGILKVNPHQQPGGKKSKQPVALDLGAMINALEKKKEVVEEKKVTISATTSVIQPTPKPKEEKKEEKSKGARPHNMLDSSAPVLKRGKEREHPKPKKPSPLKKVILKEREEKKQLRLLDDPEAENEGVPVGIGVINAESDLSQDALSSKGSMDFGAGTPASNDLSPISQTSPISMSPLSPGPSPQSSEVSSPIAGVVGKDVIRKIHSRRFREYCNQVLDKDIDNCCVSLLQDLVRFQDRMYHKDPAKAKSKRRIVLGLREVTKHLKLRKIKCVMISPNLEKIQSKGGLDDALNNILNLCNEQGVPFVFALGRRALGRACAKLVPVSVVGIFNYDGTEENFHKLMALTETARESYKDMVALVEKEVREYPLKIAAATVPHIFAHMGHSRTPSGASVLSFTSSILSEPISENYPHSEPETDSKGYEIVKENDLDNFNFSSNISNVLPANPKQYQFKMAYKHNVNEIDDGNEADTEEYGEIPKQMRGSSSEEGEYEESFHDSSSQAGSDTVKDLPHIDSIHSSSHDLCTEIMSQTSGRTIENCEAMSTHSSRTLGDGSSTILADPGDRSKHDTPKSTESPGNTLQRGKVIDEERIKSWVDETQSRLENLQLETSSDCSSENETDSESSKEDDKEICSHDSGNHDNQNKECSAVLKDSNLCNENMTEENGCVVSELKENINVASDNIENGKEILVNDDGSNYLS